MKTDDTDKEFDDLVHSAIGRDSVLFDFEQWKQQHQHEIEAGQTISQSRSRAEGSDRRVIALADRRQAMTRTLKIAAAAVIFIAVCLGLPRLGYRDDSTTAWAQMLEQIENAETMTWQITFYQTFTSKDGQRTWIETETREQAYKAPGLSRDVHLGEDGRIERWTITDVMEGKELSVNPGKQRATLRELTMTTDDPKSPFVWVKKAMEERTLEWVGKRMTEGRQVNVFRAAFRDTAENHAWSYDFWVDVETKQLVALYVPGADIFDPENDPASQNAPEETYSFAEATAFAKHHIDFNAELDDALFSLEPPQGYTFEIEGRARVTEEEMIAWLGLLAEFHGGTFPDGAVPPFDVSSDQTNAISDKAKEDRTPIEQKLLDTMHRYMMANLNGMPVAHFLADYAEKGSFRYLGKGVKLGDVDRIVCWYRLNNSDMYRAVYGDLSVTDVTPEDLPLSVER